MRSFLVGKYFLHAHSSVFQISHDKKSSVSDIEKQQQQHIKLNKTLVVFLNGPFYIFEADNIIIIYCLLHWVYYQKKKKQNSKKDLLNVEELYLHLTEGVRWMNWLTQQEGRGVCKTRTADTCGWRMGDADRKMRMEKCGKTPKKVKRIKRPRMAEIIK